MEARILVNALHRYLWLIITLALLGAVVGGVAAVTAGKEYVATASVSVAQPNLSAIAGLQDQLDSSQYIATQVGVLDSDKILDAVAKSADLDPQTVKEAVSVSQSQGSSIIDVSVTLPDATQAASVANLVTTTYMDQLNAQVDQTFATAKEDLQLHIADLQQQIDHTVAPTSSSLLQTLQSDESSAQNSLAQIEASSSVALINTQIVDNATVPPSPQPRHLLTKVVLGLAVGLALGIIAAVVAATIRPRMIRGADVEDALGVTAAAELPYVPAWQEDQEEVSSVQWSDYPAFADEIVKLGVFVEAAGSSRNCKTVLVTSVERGAGVTLVATALADMLRGENRAVNLVGLSTFYAEGFDRDEHLSQAQRVAVGEGPARGTFAVPLRVPDSIDGLPTSRAFSRPGKNGRPFQDTDYDADILLVDGGSLIGSPAVVSLARSFDLTVLVVPLPNDNERYLNEVVRATFNNARGQLLIVANMAARPRVSRA